jgi:hypothetical protein
MSGFLLGFGVEDMQLVLSIPFGCSSGLILGGEGVHLNDDLAAFKIDQTGIVCLTHVVRLITSILENVTLSK